MLPQRQLHLSVGRRGQGQRVDAYLPGRVGQLSRTRIKAMLTAGEVTVDGRRVKPSHRLRAGETIELACPDRPEPLRLVRDDGTRLEVLHEDDHLLAVSKPAGMASQPHHRFEGGTLVNAVLAHLGMDGRRGPRIMHRLDRNTTGVVLVAKSHAACASLSRQFHRRRVRKEYRALVHGVPPRSDDLIGLPIGQDPARRERMVVGGPGARPATTRVKLIERVGDRFSWLALWPRTGRTHQLRVHLATTGTPIVADEFYGLPVPADVTLRRQALHAARITFDHPGTGEQLSIEAPLPADLQRELARLGCHARGI